MKTVYVVEKIINGEKGYFFYENEPKRLNVHCTYTDKELEELICSFDSHGCYNPKIEKQLLTRKSYIVFRDNIMTMVKYTRNIDKDLSRQMGKMFLPC